MAGSVNKVTLIGNLGRDPEIRTTQDGTKVANLSLATSESWRDKTSGERRAAPGPDDYGETRTRDSGMNSHAGASGGSRLADQLNDDIPF